MSRAKQAEAKGQKGKFHAKSDFRIAARKVWHSRRNAPVF
jgi:hypothetical protein